MKRVAIVGVEGSGKTVMLAGLGELYLRPDENGIFLEPKNFETASYVAEKIARMRKGQWPVATPEDVMQGLDWTIRWRRDSRTRPETVCQISCLDFAGEVYTAAFGISDRKDDLKAEIETLKAYVRSADELLVLVNLKDVVANGITDRTVQKSMWITKNILDVALDEADGHTPPRTAIVLSQADAYEDTIRSCGGAREALDRYLPYVGNNYNWLDVLAVSAVDKTILNDDGELVPAPGFTSSGLMPLMNWILDCVDGEPEEVEGTEGVGVVSNETSDASTEELSSTTNDPGASLSDQAGRGEDLAYTLEIDFDEALFGSRRELELNIPGKDSDGGSAGPMKISLKIPAGVDNGSRLRLSGKGAAGSGGGQPGDLYVSLVVRESDIFEREGQDLFLDVPVPAVVLTLGGKVDVPTPNGMATLKIPAGTPNGKEFRLRRMGVPSLRGDDAGNLDVRLVAEIPQKLTKRQRTLLADYQNALTPEVYQETQAFSKKTDVFFSHKEVLSKVVNQLT